MPTMNENLSTLDLHMYRQKNLSKSSCDKQNTSKYPTIMKFDTTNHMSIMNMTVGLVKYDSFETVTKIYNHVF